MGIIYSIFKNNKQTNFLTEKLKMHKTTPVVLQDIRNKGAIIQKQVKKKYDRLTSKRKYTIKNNLMNLREVPYNSFIQLNDIYKEFFKEYFNENSKVINQNYGIHPYLGNGKDNFIMCEVNHNNEDVSLGFEMYMDDKNYQKLGDICSNGWQIYINKSPIDEDILQFLTNNKHHSFKYLHFRAIQPNEWEKRPDTSGLSTFEIDILTKKKTMSLLKEQGLEEKLEAEAVNQ